MTEAAGSLRTRPWLALQATLAVQMLATFVLSAAPVLAPAVAPQLGLAPERIGVFMGTVYLFAMVSGLASGPWAGRVGPTRLTQLVLLAVALGAVASTVGTAPLLWVAAALVGTGYGALNPASAAILGRHAPPGSPGLFFALKQSGVPIGIALAGLLMPLGLVALGWRGAAWAAAAACLLLAALLVPLAARLDPGRRAAAPAGAAWARSLVDVLRHPGLRRLSLVSTAYAMAQQGFLTFAVSLLTLELGLPLATAAALLAASQVACTVVRIALGHVGDRWIAPQVLLGVLGLCMAASCLALGALPRLPALPLAAAAIVLAGATTMGWNGVYFAQLLRTVPREQLAASAGGTQFFTFAGGMAGPFLFGQLLHLGGSYTAGYACLALLAAGAGLAMLWPLTRDALRQRTATGT
jgi:MFS family permease